MKELERKIREALLKQGVPITHKGFEYLVQAIKMQYLSKRKLGITKDIYPEIAIMFSTTTTGVERAIRTAICRAFDKVEVDHTRAYNFVSNSNGILTNQEMVLFIVYELGGSIYE